MSDFIKTLGESNQSVLTIMFLDDRSKLVLICFTEWQKGISTKGCVFKNYKSVVTMEHEGIHSQHTITKEQF